MSESKGITVLDCTLRDGGYYNDWVFDRYVVNRYLAALQVAGVDVIEIGFRQPPSDRFLGPFAFSSDRCLATLNLPEDVLVAVMSDAKALLRHGDPRAAVDALYGDCGDSPVDIVRVAANAAEISPGLLPGIERLKEKGYQVCLNIMQIARVSTEQVEALAREIAGYGCVDVLYFADSLGNMEPGNVTGTMGALRAGWQGRLGIHTHDNMSNALANSMAAVDEGVDWVDATVLGMGRGAGNVATEYLLHALRDRGFTQYRPDALIPIVMEDFMKLRRHYGWGPNYLYYLAAEHGIHPTYLQRLQEPGKVDPESLANALDHLRSSPAHSFSEEALGLAMQAADVDVAGNWCPEGWAETGDVLLVASGPGAEEHEQAISDLIHSYKPRVVGLNFIDSIDSELFDVFAVCHPSRLIRDLPSYRAAGRPLVTPLDELSEVAWRYLESGHIYTFGLKVEAGAFEVDKTSCTVPVRKVVPYALALAAAGGAKRVFLAGFDGFGVGDPRHQEMNEIFSLFRGRFPDIELSALTPSSYEVLHSSVYAF